MKFRYRVLLVLATFIAALVYFGSDIHETFFGSASDTVRMSESTLPTIYMQVGDDTYNRLHGYASNLDEMLMRETITPITSERTFTVLIEENQSNVKKLKYEVYNTEGREIESDSFTVLDVESGPKKVTVPLKETLKSGQEYAVKITLITNQSKRIYYYTRIKMYDDGHISEKLEFVKSFHSTLIEGSESDREQLKKYLESSRKTDNTSYANVSIKSSYDLINWGDLDPEVIWQELPAIHEFYDAMATIELKSFVRAETGSGTEYYIVRENFRFQYTTTRVYLYNYDRTMEALYDVGNTSLIRDEFKLGISKPDRIRTGYSDSRKYLAFVYGRELHLYDVDKNLMTCVFSFKDEDDTVYFDGLADDEAYSSRFFDQHDVRLIKVHDNGNVDFLVYGYMNRGEYEGRVGIVLYRYVAAGKYIEEEMYIPVNTSFQLLDADFEEFVYLSDKDVLFFSLYDAIYAYDLTTKRLETIAEDVPADNLVFCDEDAYIAWQDARSDLEARSVHVMDLRTGDERSIEASAGENIRLLGRINNNIIYAFAKASDTAILANGSRQLPAYRLCIADSVGNLLKDYREEGFYIDSIVVNERDNLITLNRVARKAGDRTAYEPVIEDTIMNRYIDNVKPVRVTRRVTERTLTEYYVSIPENIDIAVVPAYTRALNAVIDYDTTARLAEPGGREGIYYSYCYGEVLGTSLNVTDNIALADTYVGTVINREGRLIWERGIKAARASISGLTTVRAENGMDSLQAAMRTILLHKNIDADTTSFDADKESAVAWLQTQMKQVILDLTGAKLDEVLYYVYKSRPVIGFKADGKALVLTAYDAVSVTVYDPLTDKSQKLQIKDANELFEAGGNMFISYAE